MAREWHHTQKPEQKNGIYIETSDITKEPI